MTENQITPPTPEQMPAELWGLWIPSELPITGKWMWAIDEAGDPMLAYKSESDAKEGAEYHWREYEIDCIPVRLYPVDEREVLKLRIQRDDLLHQVNALIESCYYRTKAGYVHWCQGKWFGTSTAKHTEAAAFLEAMVAIRQNAGINEIEVSE